MSESHDVKPDAQTETAPASTAPSTPATPRPRAMPSPAQLARLADRQHRPALVPAAPTVTEYPEDKVREALTFGSIAEDGTISVKDGSGSREIGTAEGTDHEAALRPFVHAYLDLVAFLDLTEQKLSVGHLTQAELNRLLEQLRKKLKEPAVVGDLAALRERGTQLREQAKAALAVVEQERIAAKEQATARREEFVRSIEELVAAEPDRIQWRSATETMRTMVQRWKEMQSADVALDRSVEDGLWKRLSAARSSFDRMRRAHFADLDKRHAEAKEIKESLIHRAEAMKDSTDWGPTVRAYRSLMDEWRSAPRGQRKTDDAQWSRFKAAQDHFFAARNADLQASEAEQKQNLVVKEALLAEARALLPISDLDATKRSLRSIQDRWEDAGKVPRSDLRRIEDGLRDVERQVREAEEAEWRRTDPRTKARVQGASSQLQAAIASYEEALEKARRSGDARRIAEAEAALTARQQWLAVIERSAQDLG
ncbi:DUF349 domain-containing protein [Devriesea agamarum]|uniref:DUF349 domain-containing protein n=1 Tax=Devriesea agamarum TaxID=472569 RepID=UPI00071CF697|nr:DUF349 domain-containing protein [Devriesea agamarum]